MADMILCKLPEFLESTAQEFTREKRRNILRIVLLVLALIVLMAAVVHAQPEGLPCGFNNTCNSGLSCVSHLCTQTGGFSEPCNPGGGCNSGLTCSALTQHCLPDIQPPHPPPRVVGGVVLTNPTLVNIYWDAAWDAKHPTMTMNQIDNFTSALVRSGYFKDLQEYEHPGDALTVSFNSTSFKANPRCGGGGTAPASISLFPPSGGLFPDVVDFINCEVTGGFVPSGGQSGRDFIYNIFLPATTSEIELGRTISCVRPPAPPPWYTAYHYNANFLRGPIFTLIFANPACRVSGLNAFGNLTENLSHELVETISDPFPQPQGYFLEIADDCSSIPFLTSPALSGGGAVSGGAVSQYWSNRRAGCIFPSDTTAPSITALPNNPSLSAGGSGQDVSITIEGSGFGTLPPVSMFAANSSTILSLPTPAPVTIPYLSFTDGGAAGTPLLSAGNSLNPDTTGLKVLSWSDTSIKAEFLTAGAGGSAPLAGDSFVVTVCNPVSGNCKFQSGQIGASINAIFPPSGPVSGETPITIYGSGFVPGVPTTVVFEMEDGTRARKTVFPPPDPSVVLSSSSISLRTPKSINPGHAQVTVRTESSTSGSGAFKYCPPTVTWVSPNPASAGAQVAISGACLTGADAVQFGPVGTVTRNSMDNSQEWGDSAITVAVPASRFERICDRSWVDVQVSTPGQGMPITSAVNALDHFTYSGTEHCQPRPAPVPVGSSSGWRNIKPLCADPEHPCPQVVGRSPQGFEPRGGDTLHIKDFGEHAAEKTAITSLAQQNVLELVGPEKFAPSAIVTRGELAVSLNRAFQIPSPKFPVVFTDVELGNATYPLFANVQPYLNADQGIGGAYTFHADAPAERQQVATLAVTMLAGAQLIKVMQDEKEISAALAPYADAQAISPELRPYVATALQAKLLSVRGDNFGADHKITRGEWAQILWNMQKAFATR